MLILLHSSKTMAPTMPTRELTTPTFQAEATELVSQIASLSVTDVAKHMKVSAKLAQNVKYIYSSWTYTPPSAAAECFRGDIYSGLRALEWNDKHKTYAQKHLRILSGLYGILRPYDAVQPYRLEAAYILPFANVTSLYGYWGNRLAKTLDQNAIVNLTSAEYSKLILPHLTSQTVITPRFLTRSSSGEPTFIAVHAKVARGAFARWMIINNITDSDSLHSFNDLSYSYAQDLSSVNEPVYICDNFGGIGLSQRLK
jgi:uncharacterized protein